MAWLVSESPVATGHGDGLWLLPPLHIVILSMSVANSEDNGNCFCTACQSLLEDGPSLFLGITEVQDRLD